MRPFRILLLSVAVVSCVTTRLHAQTDARAAFDQSKAAFAAEDYSKARDLLVTASQTDPKNPEVFLWLGRAQYQLGSVEEAIKAWRQTLKLAPDQPYAERMLKALRGETTDIETRIRLVEALLQDGLYESASSEATALQSSAALNAEQRAQLAFLYAEILIERDTPDLAIQKLRELAVAEPDSVDAARMSLLVGWAKLRLPDAGNRGGIYKPRLRGADHAGGFKLLEKLVVDFPETPSAASAQFLLIQYDLQLDGTPKKAALLTGWIAAHPEHRHVRAARRMLVMAYLDVTSRGPAPLPSSDLSPSDQAALEVLATLENTDVGRPSLVHGVKSHLQLHYAKREAYGAAIAGLEVLAELPKSRAVGTLRGIPIMPSREVENATALELIAKYRQEIARIELTKAAQRGELKSGPLPDCVKAVLADFERIIKETPSQPVWPHQLAFAKTVRDVSLQFRDRLPGSEPPPTLIWSMEIALIAAKSGRDAETIAEARELFGLATEANARLLDPRIELRTVISLYRRLLEATSADKPEYGAILLDQAHLRIVLCHHQFAENRRLGKPERNAQMTEDQKALLEILGKAAENGLGEAVGRRSALTQLQAFVAPWVKHGHFDVAEQSYAAMIPRLVPMVRREIELAIVNLWVDEVFRQHAQITSAGLTVQRQLNPQLAEALVRLYEMQANLDEKDPFLGKIRAAWNGMVAHYLSLKYFDIAEAAIKTAPEQKNENAAAWAELELANLRYNLADQELARLLKTHRGKDEIQLTPAFQAAADAYTAFVSQRPDHPLAASAINGLFNIARRFERQSAFSAAVKIYRDFATVAAEIPVLNVAEPGSTSIAQRAAFAVAVSRDAQARRELAEHQEARKPDDEPSQKISDAFAATIEAYHGFVKKHPKSLLVSKAHDRVMAVALAYAKIDAWKVADSVYGGELESRVGLRHPETLKFCQALCQLGPAMPQHVQEVLVAITVGPTHTSDEGGAAAGELLAALNSETSVNATGAPVDSAPTERPPQPAVPQTASGAVGQVLGPIGGAFGARAGSPEAAAQIVENADRELAQRYAAVSQAVRRQQTQRASQIAMLDDQLAYNVPVNNQPMAQQEGQGQASQQRPQPSQAQVAIAVPVLSDAEIDRIRKIFDTAYQAFHQIETEHPHTEISEKARDELLVMFTYWRSLGRFNDSAELAERFLTDHPTDPDVTRIRLDIARGLLAFASQPVKKRASKQAMLAEVTERFATAHQALEQIIAKFPEEKSFVQQAQWDIANSYLTRARVVSAFSDTLARGQYVRAARQLQQLADQYHDHPNIRRVPEMLFQIANEVSGRGFSDEAITVWTKLTVHSPTGPLAEQAARRIAQAYENQLDQPLRAAEMYQELNFVLGGGNAELQTAIFNIGGKLKQQRRWVEALHVLETFVDTFPKHANAGQTLVQIGEIHQANEAWEDAMAAYERAISEYNSGDFVKSAKWSIAECEINLSRWQDAIDAYREYIEAYGDDEQAKTATARIDILKELASYQTFVDEEGRRKADDAQFQIARIVHEQLANPVKAIIEYRKVAENWPKSHLADDALHKVGTIYLLQDETENAREALRIVARDYPSSSLADDALFLVGKSYEDESQKLATVTRSESLEKAKEFAQKRAYGLSQDNRRRQRVMQSKKITELRQAGKAQAAENYAAFNAAQIGQFDTANVTLFAQQAIQEVETLTAAQLADRQDKINAALRKAVAAYESASRVAAGDKAAEALLRMAKIYDEQLKDSAAAVATWKEIVRQFSGTSVAEDASWRIAQYYERSGEHALAIEGYEAFLRNYRRSTNAGPAQAAIAENYERLGEWIKAMDAYTNYLNNYPDGAYAKKARDRISWIKTYRL